MPFEMNTYAIPSLIALIVGICMGVYVPYKNPRGTIYPLAELSKIWRNQGGITNKSNFGHISDMHKNYAKITQKDEKINAEE